MTFKIQNFGAPEEQVIQLSRTQIEQMAAMIENFKDVDDFQLRVVMEDDIVKTLKFTFDMDLTKGNTK